MFKRFSDKPVAYFLLGIIFYCCGVAGYAFWSNGQAEKTILADIDRRLLQAATSLKYMLAPDFHDRAISEAAISFEEELRNRNAFSRFAAETDFQWLYTLAEKNGEFFFSAPTVTEQEARERKRWYFLRYEDIPAEFVRAHDHKQVIFVNYSDHWGKFRSVALPQRSPDGRDYLACADLDISSLESLLAQNINRSIVTAGYFLMLTLPLVCVFILYNRELKRKNADLARSRNNLEKLVDDRTADLRIEKDHAEALVASLKQALDDVKKLKGLLPICANCKKIRDDQGYWKQIEVYIRDHADVDFSHSICPDCGKELYPHLNAFKGETIDSD